MSEMPTGAKVTVDSMLRNPAMVRRRLESLENVRRLAQALLPPPPKSTLRRRIGRRVWRAREAMALRLAPWLDRP